MSQSHSRDACAQESCIPCFEDENQLEARFECPICLQCLREPVLTSCGHRFCSDCIKDWLRRDRSCCPVDGKIINKDNDLFPDNFTRREILDREEHASHSSCAKEKESKLSEQQKVECRFRDVGCEETLPNDQLDAHLETEVHSHLNLLSAAYYKLKTSVQEQQLEAKAQEANLWVPDAKGHCNHNEDSATNHLQGLVRSLYERIVLLEQRNREQEIQLDNLKRQMKVVSDAASSGVEHLMKDLKLQYCGGVYVWKIPCFAVQLDALMADRTHMLYSPSFYTAPTGYRFCARMNLSPKERDYLALIIHLTKGENDDFLDWPFTGRISITLINGVYPNLHLRDTMMSRPELDAFKRPVQNINPRGFGYTEFISVQDLRTQGFLVNNCLQIKIRVQSV
ncbi:TNF receptor-associated factor 6 [Anabrus simplex]|uniref:TNF receptor-associated factor 6 n=1 Tax=Anabrus simplex TaxID=316456 RepID=UPI0034DD605C